MKLFRVSCELASPAVVDPWPIHLDAVLWSASREKRAAGKPARNVPLPVWSLTLYGETVAFASALLPGDHSHQRVTMVKRRDGIDVQHLSGRLHRGLGPGKDKMIDHLAIDGRLEWLAVAGRRRPLLKSVRRVLALGRDLRSGHGRVREWSVDEVEGAPLIECLVGPGGRARRNLPTRWCSSASDTAMGGLRPPYWTEHQQLIPAGAIVTLDDALDRECRRASEILPRPRPGDLRRGWVPGVGSESSGA